MLERFRCELSMKQTVPPRVAKKEESGFSGSLRLMTVSPSARGCFQSLVFVQGLVKCVPLGLKWLDVLAALHFKVVFRALKLYAQRLLIASYRVRNKIDEFSGHNLLSTLWCQCPEVKLNWKCCDIKRERTQEKEKGYKESVGSCGLSKGDQAWSANIRSLHTVAIVMMLTFMHSLLEVSSIQMPSCNTMELICFQAFHSTHTLAS